MSYLADSNCIWAIKIQFIECQNGCQPFFVNIIKRLQSPKAYRYKKTKQPVRKTVKTDRDGFNGSVKMIIIYKKLRRPATERAFV